MFLASDAHYLCVKVKKNKNYQTCMFNCILIIVIKYFKFDTI